MASENEPTSISKAAKRKIEQALSILKALGLPREQQNERSALTLLALLDLHPNDSWSVARNPLLGITPMMNFFAQYYGRQYAPNTRETVRRQTVHQFLQAGLIVANPDTPLRPVNSPKAVYQVEPSALDLVGGYGTRDWRRKLKEYLNSVAPLAAQYAREREMRKISVRIRRGTMIRLSPGGQNVLIEKIIREFAPRFVPGATAVYVGDTQEKWAYFDEQLLADLGVTVEKHGKMPDVVLYNKARNWLILIEAVTSHGPIGPKRRRELEELFAAFASGLVFVTAFPDKRTASKYLGDLSWETEVWLAETPTHMIHFNGERFLGPHEPEGQGEAT